MTNKGNILFILPYPLGKAPSQRFRVEVFFPILKQASIHFDTQCFFDEATWNILYKPGYYLHKGYAVIKGFFIRWYALLFLVWKYEFIFIHREAAPLGPPFFEWITAKVLRKKIVYDFDDAIWIPNTSTENILVGWLKAFWKVKWVCRWSHQVVGGNDYLCQWAKLYNKRVIKIPTCVDTLNRHNRLKQLSQNKLVIGWTGSHSTLHYLDDLVPILQILQKEVDFTFLIISNKAPVFSHIKWEFLPWQEHSEVEDLLCIDIGVMPLKHDAWSEGKCGFKLIQYMALGIPAVASPVGVNKDILRGDVGGYLCESDESWLKALRCLLNSPDVRRTMGQNGRQAIEKQYSLVSYKNVFLSLFDL